MTEGGAIWKGYKTMQGDLPDGSDGDEDNSYVERQEPHRSHAAGHCRERHGGVGSLSDTYNPPRSKRSAKPAQRSTTNNSLPPWRKANPLKHAVRLLGYAVPPP